MGTLTDILGVETPEEALYARPLMGLGEQLNSTSIPYRGVDISPKERFLLEMGKGFGGTLSSLLGSSLMADAQAQMNAQRVAQIKSALAEEALREEAKAQKTLQLEAMKQGYLVPKVDDSGRVSLAEALEPEKTDLSSFGLSPEQMAIVERFPGKEQAKQIADFVAENTRQKSIDQRQNKLGKTEWFNKLGQADQSQAFQVAKITSQAESLLKDLESAIPKYNAVEWSLGNLNPSTEAYQLQKRLLLWAQEATRLMDVGALTEGDKKTLQEIATNKGNWLARPSTIAPLMKRVNDGLRAGMIAKLESARMAKELGGDALIDSLNGKNNVYFEQEGPLTGSALMDRKGVTLSKDAAKLPPPNMTFEEFMAWKKQNGK